MPCDQLRRVTVQFGKNTDLQTLKKALEALGYKARIAGVVGMQTLTYEKGYQTGSYNEKTAQFSHSQYMDFNQNKVQEEYQRQNVVAKAEENGWQCEFNPDNRNKIKLRRQR